ncbi:MAG: hypothetical protein PHT44_00125 [Candidatus Portnoybacteria bacterium]|nr:hypothetical protein [Candidatus Portnoybacteria bacterium]MDD4982973.1 hypothetical protein [Candidatus Portnoybacteria bacterium]
MKEKIINYLKEIYKPVFRVFILLGLVISILIAFGLTVNQKSAADNQIPERKQSIDAANEKLTQEYQSKLNSTECKEAGRRYAEDVKNKVKRPGSLFPDSYWEQLTKCPTSPILAGYESDSGFKRLQSIKNKGFTSLFLNNLFIGDYSSWALLVFYLTLFLALLLPIIVLVRSSWKKVRMKSKTGLDEYRKMSSFQRYLLILFFAALVLLIFIFFKLY